VARIRLPDPALAPALRQSLEQAADFTVTEVRFAMGPLRHGNVLPPVRHWRHGVRFAAAATLRE
jgi:hypothetical protein